MSYRSLRDFIARLEKDGELVLRYQGTTLATIHAAELEKDRGSVEVLIDKGVAEIFVDGGARYIAREIPTTTGGHGLELGLGSGTIDRLEICPMKSMWKAQ